MNGLRDCVKWMQATEQEQGFFYDLVVRLRDDTLAFSEWIFEGPEMKDSLTSLGLGSYRGINDHNLVVDRKYADVLFRGLTEDYYFNKTNRMVLWGNPEHRIYQVTSSLTQTLSNRPLACTPNRRLELISHLMEDMFSFSLYRPLLTCSDESD